MGGGGGVVARAFLNQSPRIGGGGPAPGGKLDESNSVGKKMGLKFYLNFQRYQIFNLHFRRICTTFFDV